MVGLNREATCPFCWWDIQSLPPTDVLDYVNAYTNAPESAAWMIQLMLLEILQCYIIHSW